MLLKIFIIVICSSYLLHGSHPTTRTDHYFDDSLDYQNTIIFRVQKLQPSALSETQGRPAEIQDPAHFQRTGINRADSHVELALLDQQPADVVRINIPDTAVDGTLLEQRPLNDIDRIDPNNITQPRLDAERNTGNWFTCYKYPNKKIIVGTVSLICMAATCIARFFDHVPNA